MLMFTLPCLGVGPLYMLMKLAQSQEDARTVVDAIGAVRTCLIRQGKVEAFDSRLAALFTKVGMMQSCIPWLSHQGRCLMHPMALSPR